MPSPQDRRNFFFAMLFEIAINLFFHLFEIGLNFRYLIVGLMPMTNFIHGNQYNDHMCHNVPNIIFGS
jgi:hypothetical protein